MKHAKNIFESSGDTLNVGLLVMNGCNTLSVAAAVDPMRAANRRAGKRYFSWAFHKSQAFDPVLTSGISIHSDDLAAFVGDVLFVIAGFELEKNTTPDVIGQLRAIASTGVTMIGVDGGSWILAAAGLLNGYRATCHWEDLEKFSLAFPQVDLVPDRFAISGQFVTTGGASPCIDLMLHLIARRHGQGLSDKVASAFIYDPVFPGHSPQKRITIQRVAKSHPRVLRVAEKMEKTLDAPKPIKDLAREVGISVRKLEMEFKTATSRSPGAYYLDLRLGEAQRLASDTNQTVLEIAVATGFGSQASFARAFKAEVGMSLTQYRKSLRS